MSFGIQVVNDNNKVIISDRTINPIFRGKATRVALTQYGTGVWRSEFEISFAEGVIPLVGANNGAWYCPVLIYRPSGIVWRIVVLSLVHPDTAGLAVYAFSPIPSGTPVPDTGYGLNIIKSDGELAFSTELEALAPVKAVPTTTPAFTVTTNTPGTIPPSFPGGGSYRLPAWYGSGSTPAYYDTSASFSASGLPSGVKLATNWFASDTSRIARGQWEVQTRVDYYLDYWAPFCRVNNGVFAVDWFLYSVVSNGSATIASQIQQTGWQPIATNDDYSLFINCAHYD